MLFILEINFFLLSLCSYIFDIVDMNGFGCGFTYIMMYHVSGKYSS